MRALRLAEFAAIFFAFPAAVWWWRVHGPVWGQFWMIPLLLVIFGVVLLSLLRDPTFDRRALWNLAGLRRVWPWILAVFPLPAAGLAALVWWHDRTHDSQLLLSLARERTGFWALLMVAYPLLSVYPQEVIWRAFLFHRYGPALSGRPDPPSGESAGRTPWPTVLASAVSFGWMHIVFNNWVAPTLTLAGGLLFALTYARTRSTAACWAEHALWGCFIFTVGLGHFFVGGIMLRGFRAW
jgi:hypothetical protein